MALRQPVEFHPYRGHKRTVAPATEPVAATDLRSALGYSSDDTASLSDAEALGLIAQSREHIENMTGMAIISQSWILAIDQWPTGGSDWWDGVREGAIASIYRGKRELHLPRYPLQSITSVTTYDEASNSTAITVATTFDVDTYQDPGRMSLKTAQTWPVATRAINAIEVVYVCGFGDAATDVPEGIKRAVLQMATYLFAHRGDGCSSDDAYVKSGAKSAAAAYAVVKV